jgi:uncharacterized membrane protein YccC
MLALTLLSTQLAAVPRRLGLNLFRMHIENGVFVSLGMAAVGGAFALAFGRTDAVLAASGALCASIVDRPGPLPVKARMFTLAVAGATTLAFLTMASNGRPVMMGLLVAAMSVVSGLVSAYGQRAIGLGVAAILAILFGMVANQTALLPMSGYLTFFASGGIAYALFALGASAVLDDRNRRTFLSEAVHAFAAYLSAKADLYDPGTETDQALRALVAAHAGFIEKLQAARDFIFLGRKSAARRRWMAALLALLDCFDTIVSSDADIETLRNSGITGLLVRLKTLTAAFAEDCEELALALTTPGMRFDFNAHADEIAALQAEVEQLAATSWGRETLATSAFRSTGHKIALGIARLERLAQAADPDADARTILPDVDLEAFVHRDRMDPRVLASQLKLSSPVLRYTIRLTGAMTCGYLLTLLLPGMLHGGWVLLTTMLIMRANYSVTKQRRNDRIVGTAVGCIVAALLVHYIPRDYLFLPVILTVGGAHAFATVDFRVTALCASITALLQLHFFGPDVAPGAILVLERLADTLAGAGLAWGFSYLLPSWEWKNVPKLINTMIGADRAYAALSLARRHNDHDFRLARKRANDSAANLAMTVRRLADEPKIDRKVLAGLNDLITANYLLASDLASMRVLFRTRKSELDPDATEKLLTTARSNIDATLEARTAKQSRSDRLSRRSLGASLGGHNAMVSLTRRLIHIERTADRVAALAAKIPRTN